MVFRPYRIKSDEKLFFLSIYVMFKKNGRCCDWQAFSFIFLKGFEDFSLPEAIYTDSPFHINECNVAATYINLPLVVHESAR